MTKVFAMLLTAATLSFMLSAPANALAWGRKGDKQRRELGKSAARFHPKALVMSAVRLWRKAKTGAIDLLDRHAGKIFLVSTPTTLLTLAKALHSWGAGNGGEAIVCATVGGLSAVTAVSSGISKGGQMFEYNK
jgi:hypothetical protein